MSDEKEVTQKVPQDDGIRMIDIYRVVKKLVGEIEPIGSTEVDNKRFENLKTMTTLVDKLVIDIDIVAMRREDHQYSVSKAGKYASDFLTKTLGIEE